MGWGGGPSAVEFWVSGDCFVAPKHIPNISVVRFENKIHIVHIACLLQLKNMLVMQSKFTKTTPQNIFKQGGWHRCVGPGSAFKCFKCKEQIKSFIQPLKVVNEVVHTA